MPYIGTSPSQGVRRVHTYTATANQTSFSGAGAEGATLSYKDSNFVDVYQNGVKLGDADYTATSGTAIVLGTGATVSDLVVIVAYDVFSAADTVSKADGGTFDGNVTMAGTLQVDGAITSSAGATITTADNSNNLTLTSTDADANTGPNLVLQRDSASPADNDLSGTIKFIADNDAGEATDCVSIFSKIIDASNGSEDASLLVNSIVGGSQISRFNITPTEIAINDDSADLDFRVESNGNANALFVDGGNDSIGVKTASPSSYYSTDLVVGVGDNGGITIANTNTAHAGCIMFADGTSGSDRLRGQIVYDHNDDSIGMWANATNALSISSSGTATIANGVTLTDGNLVVASGHGIDFSATGNVSGTSHELLDDYEEGTFTIALTGCNVGGMNTTAYYTKIGQQVFFNWYSTQFDIANASGAGGFSGLPFQASNNGSQYGVFHYVHGTAIQNSSGGYIAINGTTGQWVTENSVNGPTFVNGSGLYAMISGSYQTDS